MFICLCLFQYRHCFLVGWCTNKSYVTATSDLWLFIHASNLLSLNSPHRSLHLYLFCCIFVIQLSFVGWTWTWLYIIMRRILRAKVLSKKQFWNVYLYTLSLIILIWLCGWQEVHFQSVSVGPWQSVDVNHKFCLFPHRGTSPSGKDIWMPAMVLERF